MEDDLDVVRYAQGDEGRRTACQVVCARPVAVGADANQRRGRRFCAHASRPAIDDILDMVLATAPLLTAGRASPPGEVPRGAAADAEGLVVCRCCPARPETIPARMGPPGRRRVVPGGALGGLG